MSMILYILPTDRKPKLMVMFKIRCISPSNLTWEIICKLHETPAVRPGVKCNCNYLHVSYWEIYSARPGDVNGKYIT